jgi:hypothetical protein
MERQFNSPLILIYRLVQDASRRNVWLSPGEPTDWKIFRWLSQCIRGPDQPSVLLFLHFCLSAVLDPYQIDLNTVE